MSYARVLETGVYIWSDGENLHFDLDEIPEDKINIFLARLNDLKPDELNDRIIKGRKLIEQNKIVEVNDDENI